MKREKSYAKPFRRAMTQTARAKAGCRRCRGKPGITRNSCSAPESVGILPPLVTSNSPTYGHPNSPRQDRGNCNAVHRGGPVFYPPLLVNEEPVTA
jgi:hypothetical protein